MFIYFFDDNISNKTYKYNFSYYNALALGQFYMVISSSGRGFEVTNQFKTNSKLIISSYFLLVLYEYKIAKMCLTVIIHPLIFLG